MHYIDLTFGQGIYLYAPFYTYLGMLAFRAGCSALRLCLRDWSRLSHCFNKTVRAPIASNAFFLRANLYTNPHRT